MNRDDIIRMAREAGLVSNQFAYGGYTAFHTDWLAAKFERFADLVAAAEREACAKLCDGMDHDGVMVAKHCADAIRARGKE
jgi:hypothetical protein